MLIVVKDVDWKVNMLDSGLKMLHKVDANQN